MSRPTWAIGLVGTVSIHTDGIVLFSSWCLRRDSSGEWVTPGLFDIVGLPDIAASGSR